MKGHKEQLVAVVGGPLDGQWFTLPDWRARLDAARYMAEHTGQRSSTLDYQPGGYQIDNPVLSHTQGWVAVHRPAASTTATPDALSHAPAATTPTDDAFTGSSEQDHAIDEDTLDLAL